jgi:hypothetical protein
MQVFGWEPAQPAINRLVLCIRAPLGQERGRRPVSCIKRWPAQQTSPVDRTCTAANHQAATKSDNQQQPISRDEACQRDRLDV